MENQGLNLLKATPHSYLHRITPNKINKMTMLILPTAPLYIKLYISIVDEMNTRLLLVPCHLIEKKAYKLLNQSHII